MARFGAHSVCSDSVYSIFIYLGLTNACPNNAMINTIFVGHCYLMMDNLQEAYQAYQQALYHLPNPRVCVR